MKNMNLEEKLYTSTEVAEILGVSLRSIYRYLEEGKLLADVKTATGRHRFTRQNINDFLYPQNSNVSSYRESTNTESQNSNQHFNSTQFNPSMNTGSSMGGSFTSPQRESSMTSSQNFTQVDEEDEDVEDEITTNEVSNTTEENDVANEPVDWLAKFREAAERYKIEREQSNNVASNDTQEQSVPTFDTPVVESSQDSQESTYYYYRSGVGGLREIARALDKSAKDASIDYALTMNAGMSLHKLIRPFSIIHSYIRKSDRSYFEKMLQLTLTEKENAQLCLIATSDEGIFSAKKEIHGLSIVSDLQLKRDLLNIGEEELARDLD